MVILILTVTAIVGLALGAILAMAMHENTKSNRE
jgi:hypothetical protein